MILKTTIAVIAITASGQLLACTKPASPNLPDPGTAVTAQMIKAKNDMKSYIKAAESYLECVESDTKKYNNMVDEMQSAAEGFNGIVKKYKKRMGAA
ncbi:MAG: hypothetical protein ACRBBW_06180 [Cellvibrionaceae bacterium]